MPTNAEPTKEDREVVKSMVGSYSEFRAQIIAAYRVKLQAAEARREGHRSTLRRLIADLVVELQAEARCEGARELDGWKDQAREIALSNADHVRWHREAQAQLAQARGLLERLVSKLEAVSASEAYRSVWALYQIHGGSYVGPNYAAEQLEARAFLAKSPAAPPHPFEPGPASWGEGCLICKLPKEDHAPPPDALREHGPRREPCICPGCPATVPMCWMTPMCRLCASEDCEHEEPAAPPQKCDGTEAGLGCDCGQIHEP